MGNKQFKSSSVLDAAATRNGPFLYALLESKTKSRFVCRIRLKSSGQLGETDQTSQTPSRPTSRAFPGNSSWAGEKTTPTSSFGPKTAIDWTCSRPQV